MAPPRLAVIGGGITGLAAALTVIDGGADVCVFEADTRLGGVIRTTPFAGHAAIDEAADAFLARVPWATDVARRVGLGDTLTAPAVSKAAVWWNGLHEIPEGLLLGMPTGLSGMARSTLLSQRGKLRAATEVFRPRTSLHSDSIGDFVRSRFGDEVQERLVDPLIGSIYAADTDAFSLTAVPQLAELATGSRSMLVAGRRRPSPLTGPVFYTPATGMGSFVDAIVAAITEKGGVLRVDASSDALARDGDGWRVNDERFDGVVLACPARHAARLLNPAGPSIVSVLESIPTAGVALVTLTVPTQDWPERLHGLSGYLVPKPRQRLMTAVSFGSQKWAHWAGPDHVVLRASLGRDGLPVLHLSDAELLADVTDELTTHLGFDVQPTAVRVSRWPNAFPQYRPHHGATIAAAERSLPSGLALAGSSYHGIGIPACVRSGQQAATVLLQQHTTLAD